MKKYILTAIFSLGFLLSPAFVSPVEAAGLTTAQATSLIELVKASPNTPSSAFVSLITVFSKITTAQATTLIDLVKASPSTPTSNFVDVILAFANDTGSTLTASLTINGQTSVTNADPLASRTWAWSGTAGATYTASGKLTDCDTASQNGSQPNWTPWTDTGATGNATSGSSSAIPGAVKYGCIITGTYNVTKDGQTTTGTATITFKHANAAGTYNLAVTVGTGGHVTSSVGIDCGQGPTQICSASVPGGTSVTLVNIIDASYGYTGYTFTGWSGSGCSGTGKTCTVTMNQTQNVTATYTSDQESTCTSWSPGAWTPATCPASGTQTRTVTGVPSGCTGGTNPPSSTQSCTYTPPVVISCTGSHPPAGNGVVLYDYSAVTISPAPPGGANTVWQYGGGSCSWSCKAPMLRDGDVGCKNPTPGSGTTITLNNSSTGGKFSGVALVPQTMIGLSGAAATGLGGTNGTFTTGSDGKTPEFWLTSYDSRAEWTVVVVTIPGYKIRSATGCTPDVSIYANKTNNRCTGLKNGTPVTINMVPGDISTVPTLSFTKSSYTTSESLSGIVVGGDPNHTWGCIQRTGNTNPASMCTSGYSTPWRLLGSSVDIAAGTAGWNLISNNQGDLLSLQALPLAPFPPDTYTMYVRTGKSVLDSSGLNSHTSVTLTAAQNTTTYPLTVKINGTGIGGVHTADYTINCGKGGIYCSVNAYSNTSITLIETPNTGSTFTGWSGACSGMGTTCTVTMNQAQNVIATFTSSSVSALNLTSLSPTSGKVGTTVNLYGSGFIGTNKIYLDDVSVDTLTTSGGATPTWISFVVPTYLPSCPAYMRPPFCVDGSGLQPGTHSVKVQNTNGTSNSLSFVVN